MSERITGWQIDPATEDGTERDVPGLDDSPGSDVEEWLEVMSYHEAGKAVMDKAAQIVRESRQ